MKIRIGGLITDRLFTVDVLLLAAYILFILGGKLLNYYTYLTSRNIPSVPETGAAYYYAVGGLIAIVIFSSALVIKFRNIYFSLCWLALTGLLGVFNLHAAGMPLSIFVLYHVMRLLFWQKHHVEFIPSEASKTSIGTSYYSLEKRSCSQVDRQYMRLYFSLGMVVLMICTSCIVLIVKS